MNERLLAIGDIHGCLDELEAIIRQVEPRENDRFVFLGDYIDRGSDTPGVVEYLIEFAKQTVSVFLLGNHEDLLLKFLFENDRTFVDWSVGGQATLDQYKESVFRGIPRRHMDFFRSLLPYYETDRFIFVHAGLKPPLPPKGQKLKDLLWIRNEYTTFDWGKTIVNGHNIRSKPLISPHRICIDTGAYTTEGYLTCCDVLTGQCWKS